MPLGPYIQFIEKYSPILYGVGIAFAAILFVSFCIWLSHNSETKYNPIQKGRAHVSFMDVFEHVVIYPLFGVFVIVCVVGILYLAQNGLNLGVV